MYKQILKRVKEHVAVCWESGLGYLSEQEQCLPDKTDERLSLRTRTAGEEPTAPSCLLTFTQVSADTHAHSYTNICIHKQ